MVSPLNRRIRRLKLIVIVAILLYAIRYTLYAYSAQESNYIRVAIIQDTVSLRLKINGLYEVIDSASNRSLSQGRYLNTTVTAYKYGILLGSIKANTNRLLIKPKASGSVVINGRRFRGDIQLIKKDNLHLLAVNYIELEDYIQGILYHEASHYWPIEALKAQAIVCRTYAAYQIGENKSKDYDVTSDIYSQVYGGKTSERYRTNKAVAQTKGQILTYQDKIFPAYFHATCGGHTEEARLLWNIDMPPLRGVTCGFCRASPHFRWHCVLDLKEIADKLTQSGYKIDNIQDIDTLDIDKSGRAINLKFVSDNGELKISTKDFRHIFGPSIIRSTNFKVKVIDHDAVFEGFGWGHGVGLCQWGAYFMAKTGSNAEEIIQYYYPGSQITTLN